MVRLDEAGRLALHLPIAPCVKVTEAVTKSTPGVFFPVFCTLCSSHPFAAHSSLVVAFARRRRWAPPGSFFCTLVPCYPVFVVSLFASTTEGEQTTAQKKGPSQTDVLKTSCQFISHFRSRRRHRRQLSPAPRTRRNPNERGCSL